MTTSQTSPSDEHSYAQKPLIIFQESGKTYRPFTNPTRIRYNDAKRRRTNVVPEEFLGVMDASSQIPSSPRREKSKSPSLNTSTTPPSPASLECELKFVDESPTQPESAQLEVSPRSYSCFPSAPSPSPSVSTTSTQSSPCITPTSLDKSSVCQDSSPSPTEDSSSRATCSPSTPTHDQQHPAPEQTQDVLPPNSTYIKTETTDSLSWQPSNNEFAGIDLEDPAVFEQALEIVRAMRVEDMDLDLDLLCPDHDVEQSTAAPLAMDDRKTAVWDGGVFAPLPLRTYPCEFLGCLH